MRVRKRWVGAAVGLVIVLVVDLGGVIGVGSVAPASAAGVTCPLAVLKQATKPVQITVWHSMARANEQILQSMTNKFNSSQGAVQVKLINQIDYVQTFNKYKSGLASGDLPDIVQLQETDQQQMVDTGTVLPAAVCAKADKYSFSDYEPRVVNYFTIKGSLYAMPFNTSSPILYYNKRAFSAAGLDPDKPPTTFAELRQDAVKLKANGVSAPLGLKVEPGFFEHWMAKAGQLYVDQRNGRQGRATKTVFDDKAGRSIFTWLAGMVKDGLATTNPALGTGTFDNLLGIRSGSHAMAIDTSAALATVEQVLAAGNDPNVELGVAPMPGPTSPKGGVLNSGGELFIVNKSKPEKQAAAWQFVKFLDDPAQQTAWAIGTGYLPIRKTSAASQEMKDYWAKNPTYKVAFDQLVGGVNSAVTAGSVIGNFKGVRDAVQDAENSMFLEGKDPKSALKAAAGNATAAMKDYNTRLGG